jgi:hypothetical protein
VFTNGETDAVLVTESTARRYWPGQDALAQTIFIEHQRRQVVGVVRDAQVSQTRAAVSSYLFLPAAPGTQRTVLARTQLDPAALAAAVRAETAPSDCMASSPTS